MPMKKWPLLDSHPEIPGGSPRIGGIRITTEHVYKFCAGSASDAHVKMCLQNGPGLTAKQSKEAIEFEEAPQYLRISRKP